MKLAPVYHGSEVFILEDEPFREASPYARRLRSFRSLMARITLKHTPFGIRLRCIDALSAPAIGVLMVVRDRKPPHEPLDVMFRFVVPDELFGSAHDENELRQLEFVEFVRGCIHQAMQHEADECIYLDGYRVVDPHVDRSHLEGV